MQKKLSFPFYHRITNMDNSFADFMCLGFVSYGIAPYFLIPQQYSMQAAKIEENSE